MTGQTEEGSVELEVRNFGPIVEAKVDLRPLTVFVGPSNTGKSYLAILIYALHRVFDGYAYSPGNLFRNQLMRPGDLSQSSIDILHDMFSSYAVEFSSHDDDFSSYADDAEEIEIILPDPITDELHFRLDKALAEELTEEVCRCFGVGDIRTLVRKGSKKKSQVFLRRHISAHADILEHTGSLARKPEFKTMLPADLRIPIRPSAKFLMGLSLSKHRWRGMKTDEAREYAALELLSTLGGIVLPSLIGPLRLPAFYLPADRTGVMHAHAVVVSALIANSPVAGLRPPARTPMLSGVLADFLEQLIKINQSPYLNQKTKNDFAKKIEECMLDGSVRNDRTPVVNYPNFAFRPHGWKDDIALMRTSSMISELAPIVLYLRYIIKPDNILIVEEPESHLHPQMQVELTRQLATLVKSGIRVIVTTHSEWLLEELANIVQRSKLSNTDHSDKIALRQDQVGLWLFEPKQRPKGSTIREIALDDSGLYPSGYDEVARALHNESANIFSRIGEDS